MPTGSFDKIQWLGIIFSLIILLSVIFLVRERLIKEKYSLVWLLIGLFVFVMSVFRGLLEGFSALIGVDYAPSAFFALLIAFAYLLLLNLSDPPRERSRMLVGVPLSGAGSGAVLPAV